MIGRMMVVGAVAIVATACASKPRAAVPQERTVLLVDNQGYYDMTVYIVAGARRQRVGIAGGLKKTELTIPPHMLGVAGPISFVADPIGETRTSFSQEIYVRAGERVTLTIPPR